MLGPCWCHVGLFFDLGLLGSLERFLGTSGLVWGASWADFSSRGSIFEGLGLPGEGFGASRTLLFHAIALVWPNKCIHCCRKPILAIASAFRSPLKRGGTCAAHGICFRWVHCETLREHSQSGSFRTAAHLWQIAKTTLDVAL